MSVNADAIRPEQDEFSGDVTSPADAGTETSRTEQRQLFFRTSGLAVELEITGLGGTRQVAGQLIPRQAAVVDIRHPEGTITVEADALGHFSAAAVPAGRASLRCHLGTGRARGCVVTGWVPI